ncbi:MAG: C1 family peptidase [Anaerolineaceae bacterium]|nr:C1 family peptidase [Anaerolineaceae bacterium]
MAKQKIVRITNCVPSSNVTSDWLLADADAVSVIAPEPEILPGSVDLREDWWQIGDQGATGSCVGWAAADSVLRWHLVRTERITPEQLLSVRYIWMAAKETDEFNQRPTSFIEQSGTSLKAALDVARKYGLVASEVLPFQDSELYAGTSRQFYILAAQLRIISYFNLQRNITDWKRWIATEGPILTRLDVDDSWWNATSTNGNLDEYHKPPAPAGHAVALVGYTEDRFIVRNSWGTHWGDGGFAYASIPYAQAAFTEAYGVMA